MRRLLLLLPLLLLGCPRGMFIQVDMLHRVRCALVKNVGLVEIKTEEYVSLEECLVLLDKVLQEWRPR